MSSSNDDAVGWLIGIALVAGGGWWLWTNYEVKEREAAPIATAPPIPRPTGMVVLTEADSTGVKWSVDADSIRGPREARQGWVIMDASKDASVSYRTSKTLYQFNCATGESRRLSEATYGADGKNLTGESWSPKDADLSYFPPDSMGGTVGRTLCAEAYDTPPE